jgi:hypothetical protein
LFESVGSYYRRPDFRVQSLYNPIRHFGVEEINDILLVSFDSPGGVYHELKPAVRRPKAPTPPFHIEQRFGAVGDFLKNLQR